MSKTKRIATIAATATLLVIIGVTAVFAMTNSMETLSQPPVADAHVVEEQPAVIGDLSQHSMLAGRGLTEEQIDWIMHVMDTGKLPDLNDVQIAEFKAIAAGFIAQGFPDGNGEFVLAQFEKVFSALENDGSFMSAEMIAALMASLSDILERALTDGIITEELYDIIKAAMQTGTIELSDEQTARLREKAAGLLVNALAEEKITQDVYDVLVSALETGSIELSDEQTALMMEKAGELLMKALEEGKITQEQFDEIVSLLENGIPECPDISELTDEQKAALQAKLEELKPELQSKAKDGLGIALDEGLITPGLYGILISAVETCELEYSSELDAELKLIAKQLLAMGLEKEAITEKLHNILASAIDTGNLAINEELLVELQAIVFDLLDLGLEHGFLTQEQYDWLTTELKIAIIQIGMRDLMVRN